MLLFFFCFFFQFQKRLFTQYNLSKQTANLLHHKPIKHFWNLSLLYILMQILPYLCLHNYCKILIKLLNWRLDVMFLCRGDGNCKSCIRGSDNEHRAADTGEKKGRPIEICGTGIVELCMSRKKRFLGSSEWLLCQTVEQTVLLFYSPPPLPPWITAPSKSPPDFQFAFTCSCAR